MRPSDVRLGRQRIIKIRPSSEPDFGIDVNNLDEVRLLPSGTDGSSILQVGDTTKDIRGFSSHDQEQIKRMLENGLARLAWVTATKSTGANQPIDTLVVEVREFVYESVWPETIDLGIDDKIVDAMRKKYRRISSATEVIKWMTDRVLIAGPDCSRVLLSSGPRVAAGRPGSFRLHGNGISIDVYRDREDRLIVTRFVPAQSAGQLNETRPVILIQGDFKFVDSTIAGKFRGSAKSQLDQLVAKADSYMDLWQGYNKLELSSILEKARDFGWFEYHDRRQLADGRWQFKIKQDSFSQNEEAIQFLKTSASIELATATSPPLALTQQQANPDLEDFSIQARMFTGALADMDQGLRSIYLLSDKPQIDPPDEGVLFLSLKGDVKRLERRTEAFSRIREATCEMPQLGLLIEGTPVPERRQRQVKPLSSAVRKCFGGEPTGRQVEALSVALNTPDIALIQGPPGTGKTRTIAALQARLSEQSENTRGIGGRYLLTSYQHDAVENVANATQVFGLPAMKIGRRRGDDEENTGYTHWRQNIVESVSAQLAGIDEFPVSTALRKCRDLALGYLQAPSKLDDVTELLGRLRKLAEPHVPLAVCDKLLELQQELGNTNSRRTNTDAGDELALKAVRGLRTDPATFSDDGDIQAYKVLRRLEDTGILKESQLDILRKASEWDESDTPDFLHELKELQVWLMDQLTSEELPQNAPLVNADVEAALGLLIDALHESVRSSRSGVDAALFEYRDDLENDLQATRETIEHYTVALAATCQQAVGFQMCEIKNEANIFETVIVDEAARANPLDLFIPMSLAERRIILVGDHRQLPHVLDHEIENDLNSNVEEKTREMLQMSLFERLYSDMRRREKNDGVKRTVTLDTQYRMHPILGDFVSDTFYKPHGETFQSGRDSADFEHSISAYEGCVAAWVDLPIGRGSEQSGMSKRRRVEARWVAEETKRILEECPSTSVGVITFYSAQVNEIQRQMEKVGLTIRDDEGGFRIAGDWKTNRDQSGKLRERLRVGTVDAFQGKEFDVVILSMTRSNNLASDDPKKLRRKYGHLMLENRLCVGMSRQQCLLIVVGDAEMLRGNAAASVLNGLVSFRKLCEGKHGIQLQA